MQSQKFYKFHGSGNDFIIFDCRETFFSPSKEQIIHLCTRGGAFGADGVVLLKSGSKAAFRMEIFNADGSVPAMCGNALRCLAKLLSSLEAMSSFAIETGAGIKQCRIAGHEVAVLMGEVRILDSALQLDGQEMVFIDSGVPHLLLPVPNVDQVDLPLLGKKLRFHPRFAPEGTNVNVFQSDRPSHFRLRTYERGVEGETLSCGTGATALAYYAFNFLDSDKQVNIKTKHGDVLQFNFICDKEIEMVGPAEFLFEGRVTL